MFGAVGFFLVDVGLGCRILLSVAVEWCHVVD